MIHARGSMFARLLLLGTAAFLMAAQSSCSWNGGEGSAEIKDPPANPGKGTHTGDTLETTLSLKDSAGKVTATFKRGDLITFELTVHNRTNTALHITFPMLGNWYDFQVFDKAGTESRWTWSADKSFAAVVTNYTLEAGATQTYTGTWDQVSGDGFIAPGTYEAYGAFLPIHDQVPTVTPEETVSPRVPFTIE